MNSSKNRNLWLLAVAAVVILASIGLFLFLRSPAPTPKQPVASQDMPSRPIPQQVSVDAKPSPELAIPVDDEEPEGPDVLGAILDEKGTPVAGASVAASQVDSGARSYDAATSSEDDGTYSLTGLKINSPFSYKIVASVSGYAPTASTAFSLDRTPKEINITLLKGASVSGRVTTTFAGDGIQGATLSLIDSSMATGWLHFYTDFENVPKTTSDEDGSYSFPNVPPGEYWLYAQANGFVDDTRLLSILPEDAAVTVDLTMDHGGEEYFAGVVVDEKNDTPVKGARVECRQDFISANRTKGIRRAVYTDAEGKFLLEGFMDHRQHPSLTVTRKGYQRYDAFNTDAFEDKHNIRIPLRRAFGDHDSPSTAGQMSGRVFDNGTSKAIPSFTVSVMRTDVGVYFSGHKKYCDYSKTFHSPDGSFSIQNIDSGSVSLLVSAPGYATQRKGVNIYPKVIPEEMRERYRKQGVEHHFENFFEIGLEAGATVSGAVYDLRSGEPLSGVQVAVDYDRQSYNSFPITASAFTDEQGRYALEGIPEGPLCIIASHPDYAPAFSDEFEFRRGGTYDSLDFFLGSGGSVGGMILDPNMRQKDVKIGFQPIDSPVLLKKIGISRLENRLFGPPRVAMTDALGRYRVDGLTPGYCLISAWFKSGDGESSWSVKVKEVVEVRERRTTTFDIPVCKGETIEGKIYFDESFPSDPEAKSGTFYSLLRRAGAPAIDLSSGERPVIELPIYDNSRAFDPNREVRFYFHGVCPGEYMVTILPHERTPDHKEIFVDQKSVSVTVRPNRTANVTVDFRRWW